MTRALADVAAQQPWFFPTVAFLFGACIGSFLNVVIYRVPAGRSIVRPGSACACGAPIAWYDNIPLVSWFVLGAQCRHCGSYISARYVIVEFLTACLFGLAHGEPLQFAGLALFGVVLALVIHRTRRLVPSVITHVSFNAVAMVGLIVQRSGH